MRRREFSTLPASARAYVVVVTALGVVTFGLTLPAIPFTFTPVVLLVAATAALTTSLRLPLPTMKPGATLSVAYIVNFTSLLTLGADATTLAAVTGAVSQSTFHLRRASQLYRTLFNVGCLVITVHVTGLTWTVLGGVTGDLSWPGVLTPLVGSAIVYFLANTALVAATMAFCTSQPFGRVWRDNFLATSPSYLIGAAVAAAIAESALHGYWEFIPAIGVAAALALWTHRQQTEASLALQRSEERYALAAAGANDGLWDWDVPAGTIHLSARWHAMLGTSEVPSTCLLHDWLRRVHPDDLPSLSAALEAHILGQTEHFTHEHRILHSTGAYRWVLCRGTAVRGADGHAVRVAGSLTDITDRVWAQESLRRAAQQDTLTGLANRALFVELVRQTLTCGPSHPERRCAVMFLDLDRFKIVNDTLGHFMGDQLLVVTARRLLACLREGDTLARLGGDEFTVLLPEVTSLDEAIVVAQRIQGALRAPLSLGGRDVLVSASIGIALSTPETTDPIAIMRDADVAMYRAKAAGKACHAVFDDELQRQTRERFAFEDDLRRALERDELSLVYQPIVNTATHELIGFEALVRWTRAGQEVPPTAFIPVAEAIGLMPDIGNWILCTACRQMGALRRTTPGARALSVGVNVSSDQLLAPSFVILVRSALAVAGLPPDVLRLEITETTFTTSPDAVESVLRQLRAAGVKVCLDDFGVGSSLLTHLHRAPVDLMKIDRRFIGNLTDANRPPVVETILAVARTLGAEVIAAGVETEAQLHELIRLGCHMAQGYLFFKPMSVGDVETFLAGVEFQATRTVTHSLEPAAVSLEPAPVVADNRQGDLTIH